MLLRIFLFLTFIVVCTVQAFPNKPGCDLVGSSSGLNVMTRTSIMGATPIDATNLITFSTSQYSQADEKITVMLANLNDGGAVIHTSAGTLSSANSAQTTPAGYAAKTGCTDKMLHKQNGVAPTLILYLTVPNDITSVNSITISVLTASGYGNVTRQTKSVSKASAGFRIPTIVISLAFLIIYLLLALIGTIIKAEQKMPDNSTIRNQQTDPKHIISNSNYEWTEGGLDFKMLIGRNNKIEVIASSGNCIQKCCCPTTTGGVYHISDVQYVQTIMQSPFSCFSACGDTYGWTIQKYLLVSSKTKIKQKKHPN